MDGLLLDLVARTVFHAGDFARGADGARALHPQLAKAVVAACRVPQERIDEQAKWLAGELGDGHPPCGWVCGARYPVG